MCHSSTKRTDRPVAAFDREIQTLRLADTFQFFRLVCVAKGAVRNNKQTHP
jgi:hypothetical protein